MECLDVGAACGLLSFGLKARGAKSITAADIVRFPTFEIARKLLDLDVEYLPTVSADRMLDAFPDRRFDLIVCAGLLYHMFNPIC